MLTAMITQVQILINYREFTLKKKKKKSYVLFTLNVLFLILISFVKITFNMFIQYTKKFT